MLVTLSERGRVYFRFLDTNGFHVKAENDGFSAVGSRCWQNLKYENFGSSFGRLRENCPKKRAARAARLSFLVQPIISLIYDVMVAAAFVVSSTP